MSQLPTNPRRTTTAVKSVHFWQRLKEIDLFFQGKDQVHKTMRRVVKRLEKASIPYAIVGGMAVNAHNYRRTTADVDLLLTAEGFAEFRRLLVPRYYENRPGRQRRFVDRKNEVGLDILVTGMFPGTGNPGPLAYPDPTQVSETIENVRIVDLVTLVQLKLAARRHRDFGDVVELIRFNQLDESFAERLHPSVRKDYIECLEEKRREDDYEEREG
jgi:hypothetical protein